MKKSLLALAFAWLISTAAIDTHAAITPPQGAVPSVCLRACSWDCSSSAAEHGCATAACRGQRSGAPIVSVTRSTAQKYAGASSLAVRVNGSGSAMARVANPAAKAGDLVTFRIFIPSGARLSSIRPFVLQGADGGWRWTGTWRAASTLRQNAWNTIAVQVPSNASLLSSLGVEITTSGSYNGTLHIDSVDF